MYSVAWRWEVAVRKPFGGSSRPISGFGSREARNRTMIERWLHLIEEGGGNWVARIWTALQRANKYPPPGATGNLGYYVNLRLKMLNYHVGRVRQECTEMFDFARTHGEHHVFTRTDPEGAHGFRVDDEAKHRLMVDIDALLFELKACAETMEKFLEDLYGHLGLDYEGEDFGRHVQRLLTGYGLSTAWFPLLNRHRNYFIHEAAPYLAVDVSGGDYDLIVMRGNLRTFDNPTEYVTLKQLNQMVTGLHNTARVIVAHIVEACEGDDAGRQALGEVVQER